LSPALLLENELEILIPRRWNACVLLVIVSLLTCDVLAESSVWKVSKGENYFYLGGTVHLLSAQDHPLPEEFTAAYQDASVLFFETDLVATQSPEFQAKLLATLTYSDDRTLASELTANTYQRLESYMALRQISLHNFDKFKPWGLSLMISLMEYQRLGKVASYGVDATFNALALADNKSVMSLETPDEQLGFISSMATMDPNMGLDYTLRDLERLPEFSSAMKKHWRTGDLAAISANVFVVEMKTKFAVLYNTLLTTRNNAWMRRLPALLDDSATEFVLVGAMHLVGEEGLLQQLKKAGFEVVQL